MGEVSIAGCDYEVVIAGAGPAGAALALWLRRLLPRARVLLLERGGYPRHKVCGEFISAAGAAELAALAPGEVAAGIAGLLGSARQLSQARLRFEGATLAAPLSPPALSITRHALDHALWKACLAAGVECRERAPVTAVAGSGPFAIRISEDEVQAPVFVDASGRWSNLSRRAPEPRMTADSTGRDSAASSARDQWVGVKAHFREPGAAGSVDLYFFRDGYCGVQPLGGQLDCGQPNRGQADCGQAEDDTNINACAMVRASAATSLADVLAAHPALAARSRHWQPLTEEVATAPLRFAPPRPWDGRILRLGDAAGFVDPFLGDGITLALMSAHLAAECLAENLESAGSSRWGGQWNEASGLAYQQRYRRRLAPVFSRGAWLRRLLRAPRPLRAGALAALRLPTLARMVVERTRP